ncbi:palmitoyl-acyl carrier protein thioesterase, chloroplastic [Selaginella moellendorffii]|uniref:palmitoyl-acyl carrier protein thioesterase, chloroplastic n=1 Tax=Selaginella moellendorffii TaxID=88036 RepID=UPI000D1C9AB4|nr:palmitoyl-acyl carrier protein thioesterase, chloroplastic [Selaginella moellendorffii]|eukprot:XP_024536260.1 palmitoyl-acyl carrier protein thioesterase, chloroplastic [Selaginella moellendorffii]
MEAAASRFFGSTISRDGPFGSDSLKCQHQHECSPVVQCLRDLVSSVPKLNGSRTHISSSESLKATISNKSVAFKDYHGDVNDYIPLLAAAIIAVDKNKQQQEVSLRERSAQMKRGRLLENDLVYRQRFVIRSYEVGFDRLASIETLTNLFQETALNHVGMSDFVGDGLGTTHAMMRNGLIWVVTRMHIDVDRYPVWGDIVEIDSWIHGAGKNFIRRDFMVRDFTTGATVCRATSTWAMMNKSTRRLSKIPDDVFAEISPYFLDRHVMEDDACQKIVKLDDTAMYVQKNLVPRLHDMDMNQHVNNVKYIGWVLESVPQALLVAHELMSMTLEYRRECAASDIVTSLTSPAPSESSVAAMSNLKELGPPDIGNPVITTKGSLHYTHLLRMQDSGCEILRGRTVWRLKERFSSSS